LRVEGDLTVAAGDKLTLLDADIIAGGTLTATAGASNDATISFEDASGTSPTFDVAGTLTLTGTSTSERNAKVLGDADSRINVEVTGTFSATDFTFEYPDVDGLNLTGTNLPTIVRGTFDKPANSGCLLNFEGQTDLPNSIDGCVFDNTAPAATNPVNVKSNAQTASNTNDVVQFTNFSGDLCGGTPGVAGANGTPNTAEDNDLEVGGNRIQWFGNIWYSSGNDKMHLIIINGGVQVMVQLLVLMLN
jgi:hypothetical protein